jgi:hypothetical protein
VRLLSIINGLGVLASAGYTGFAFTPSHTPLWGGVATLMFMAALFIPLAATYGSLGRGFNDVSNGFVKNRRRERGMGPSVEVFSDEPQPPMFQQTSRPKILAVIVCVFAFGLLAYDIWSRQSNIPAPKSPGIISNY